MRFPADSLLARIDAIGNRLNAPERAWVQVDLRALTLDVCANVAFALDVEKLEARLTADTDVDAAAIAQAVELLRRVPSTDFDMPGSTQFSLEERLAGLEDFARRAQRAPSLPAVEWALQRSMLGDGQFDGLLIALRGHDDVRRSLRDQIRAKLDDILSDAEAIDLLARYQSETQESREVRIALQDDIANGDIFRVSTGAEARDRCADYIAMQRPKLERRMLENGANYLPADFVGIATILSWRSGSPYELRPIDRRIIGTISRIAACWASGITGSSSAEMLGAALRVPPNGFLVGGRGMRQALDALNGTAPTAAGLLAELVKLVRFADIATASHPVEDALRAYKSGLEVMMPDSRRDLLNQDEKWLQRHACKFLVERGIPAMGATFGRQEVDLRAQDAAHAVLIEAKKNVASAPSDAKLRGWFAQLMTYMSEEPLHNRGVLLIFNFHATTIVAPRGYLHGRHLVLPVNLCLPTASRRVESVIIEESLEPGVFLSVRRNQCVPSSPSGRRPAGSRRARPAGR